MQMQIGESRVSELGNQATVRRAVHTVGLTAALRCAALRLIHQERKIAGTHSCAPHTSDSSKQARSPKHGPVCGRAGGT
jgi:hypothetical protein